MFSRITVILENFINNCFKVFLDNKYRVREKVITVPKKTLFLVLPYLGSLSLQTRTKLRKSLKGILNCCKLQIVFKSQNKLAKAFRFKDRIPKELTSGVVYKFQCGLCNESYYGECIRHLNVRIGEHIRISPLKLLWLEMTLFSKKTLHNYRKTFITQPKRMIFC